MCNAPRLWMPPENAEFTEEVWTCVDRVGKKDDCSTSLGLGMTVTVSVGVNHTGHNSRRANKSPSLQKGVAVMVDWLMIDQREKTVDRPCCVFSLEMLSAKETEHVTVHLPSFHFHWEHHEWSSVQDWVKDGVKVDQTRALHFSPSTTGPDLFTPLGPGHWANLSSQSSCEQQLPASACPKCPFTLVVIIIHVLN